MILMLSVGSVFVALGVGVCIALISSVLRADPADVGFFIVVPIILWVLIPITFGAVALVMGGKPLYHLIKTKQTLQRGLATTARLVDYKTVSHHGRLNRRFALKLAYALNGEPKTFTTDYVFDVNELKYLKSLSQIPVKVSGNFVAVAANFPDEIYQIVPRYEIPVAFFQQSIVRKTLRIFWRLCPMMMLGLLAAIVLTCVWHNGVYLVTAAIIFVAFNLPFALILAVCLIKWLRRKR